MNDFSLRRIMLACLLSCAATGAVLTRARAQEPAAPTEAVTPEPAAQDDDWQERPSSTHHHRGWLFRARNRGNDVVGIGHDSMLPAGERATSVVSILGSSTVQGDAENVVSILGNTHVTGRVSDGAVAVLGNTYIDSKVGNATAVMGNVTLGPHAEIEGDVVAVLGTVQRDPGAIIHGSVQNVVGGESGDMAWLHTWIHHCLFYGRPLAFDAGLGWAWGLALGYLLFYVMLALIFPSAVNRCVRTVETEAGHAALAALAAILLTPVVVVLLCVTLIGIPAIPFVAVALLCAGLFGKAVMLAWVGHRVAGSRLGPASHPASAVALGGVLMLVLYVVPVLGFLVYQLLGLLGFGAVAYTLLASLRARSATAAPLETAAARETSAPLDAAASRAAASEATPTAATSPLVSAAMPRAGFWIRMGALLVDAILIGIVLSLLHPLGHFHLIVLAAYGAAMWKTRGSTIGGRLFDLQVVRLDGRPVEWETAIVRALGCFLSLAIVGLGFIWIAFDRDNQAWHDKIAGTVVVRVPRTLTPGRETLQ